MRVFLISNQRTDLHLLYCISSAIKDGRNIMPELKNVLLVTFSKHHNCQQRISQHDQQEQKKFNRQAKLKS